MPSPLFYPSLSTVLSPDNLPAGLQFVGSAAGDLFQKVFFKDLNFRKNKFGDIAEYDLDLILYSNIGFSLPGTELTFAVNAQTGGTSIPVSLKYQLPVLKYLNYFKLSSFAGGASDYFQLLLAITKVSAEEILRSSISEYDLDSQSIANWISNFNAHFPQNAITVTQNIDPEIYFGNLISALSSSNVNITEAVFTVSIASSSFSAEKEKMESAFSRLIGIFSLDTVKEMLYPNIELFIKNVSVSIGFPRSLLVPVNSDINSSDYLLPLPEPNVSQITFSIGSVGYSTKEGILFRPDSSLSLNKSRILSTDLILTIEQLKIDLSTTSNLSEANSDGRGPEFIGVYILEGSIEFAKHLNSNTGLSNARIYARNLLVGTGGVSGKLGLEPLIDVGQGNVTPAVVFNLGGNTQSGDGFLLGLTGFDVELKQNAIIRSEISGFLTIPGFKDTNGNIARLDVLANFGLNGDFRVTVSENDGIEVLKIPDVFELTLTSVSLGSADSRWYIEASGSILITANIPNLSGDFLSQPIGIRKVRIWQDGSIEFVGGSIPLPTHASLKFGPVSLGLSNMSFGSHEGTYRGQSRQYFFFGFNGALSTGAGGVDVRGDGIEFHFTRDAGTFHSYLRVAGIGIDIKVPGNASAESADVLIKGYLAVRHGTLDASGIAQDAGPDYQGSVSMTLRPLRIAAKAGMNMRPKVPAWIVDVSLDLPVPIPLGPTGLGIYGFRGMIGSHYVASKPYIGVDENASWYEYLKKKVAPEMKQGIYTSKFDPAKKGFTLGIGASIATMGDQGWVFSSKVFVMVSIPEMLLVEGQASVLHKRLGIESENDPPFYAFLVIDNHSVQAGIGVNYNLPDNGGEILKVRGEMQLGFFFGNSSAWYLNLGQDLPEEKRLQARLFTLFNAYAYVMLSSRGIKAGAGARFELKKKFGPVRFGLYAYIDTRGFISFRPVQIGGGIELGGGVYLKVFGVGLELHVSAGLSAEAPKPFVISGFLQLRLRLIVKIRIRIEFTWIFNRQLNWEEVPLIDTGDISPSAQGTGSQLPFKAINMLSDEALPLYFLGNGLPNPEQNPQAWDAYVVPMDSFIDFEFKRPVKPYTNRYGGGINPLPQFTEYVSPQQARMPQVKHSFSIENIEILIWNPVAKTWRTYNPWEALVQGFVNTGLTVSPTMYNFGYWQYNNVAGKYSSLRVLSQTPLAVANGVPPEQFGILSSQILCEAERKKYTCQYWNIVPQTKTYRELLFHHDRSLVLLFNRRRGTIGSLPNAFGVAPSLKVRAANKVEILLKEPMAAVDLEVTALSGCTITYFEKVFSEDLTISLLPAYDFQPIQTIQPSWQDQMDVIHFESPDQLISKIVIEANECNREELLQVWPSYWDQLQVLWQERLDSRELEPWQKQQIQDWIDTYSSGYWGAAILPILCSQWADIQANSALNEAEKVKLNGWISTYCGQPFSQEVLNELCNDWSSIRMNFEAYPHLAPYASAWQELYCKGELDPTALFDVCSLYVHEVCWLNEKDWSFNILLYQNNQAAITTGINSLSQAINSALPPVWRPHSTFAIKLELLDKRQAGSASQGGTTPFYVGFKTAGPIGFYHQDRPEFKELENFVDPVSGQRINKADQYKLANLRFYVDYQRSYPNADGKLVGAKPLYYKDPELGLFFTKPYVYEFFMKWDTYEQNVPREFRLVSLIMDPLDTPGSLPVVPEKDMSWTVHMGQNSIPIDSLQVETMSNMLTYNDPSTGTTYNCTAITNTLVPPTMSASVKRDYPIKPRKLYNAVFKAREIIANGNKESIVHSYSFETSRYSDFHEHVQSYFRKTKDPISGADVTREALLPVTIARNSHGIAALKQQLYAVATDGIPPTDPLRVLYASQYDRIIAGVLELETVHTAEDLEINVIRMQDTDSNAVKIVGLWVVSPEPFNDPKLPKDRLQESMSIHPLYPIGRGQAPPRFEYVYSKDAAAVFILNKELDMRRDRFRLTFNYLKFNGVTYDYVSESLTINLNQF